MTAHHGMFSGLVPHIFATAVCSASAWAGAKVWARFGFEDPLLAGLAVGCVAVPPGTWALASWYTKRQMHRQAAQIRAEIEAELRAELQAGFDLKLKQVTERFALDLKQLAAQHEAEAQRQAERHMAELQQILKKHEEEFFLRTSEHHEFAHLARDFVVKMLVGVVPRRRNRAEVIIPDDLRPLLDEMLRHMIATFQPLVPKARLYAAIRQKQGDHYATINRVGCRDAALRERFSEKLPRQSVVVSELVSSFKQGDCILLTGSGCPTWHQMKNDRRNEDLSVLLGAVFTKEWSKRDVKFNQSELTWIVGMAADVPGAFTERHKPLMKAFNDIFGLILNVLVRQPPGNTVSFPATGTNPGFPPDLSKKVA